MFTASIRNNIQKGKACYFVDLYYCTLRMTDWLKVNDLSGSIGMGKITLFDKIKELKPK